MLTERGIIHKTVTHIEGKGTAFPKKIVLSQKLEELPPGFVPYTIPPEFHVVEENRSEKLMKFEGRLSRKKRKEIKNRWLGRIT